jgi:hypothetical protein
VSFYDQDGKSFSFEEWQAYKGQPEVIVGHEEASAPDGALYAVRTGYEGLSEEPWECAVTLLSGADTLNLVGCYRYQSRAEAEIGHDEIVDRIMLGNKLVRVEVGEVFEKCLKYGVPLSKITDPITGRIDEAKLVAEDSKLPVEAEEVKIG